MAGVAGIGSVAPSSQMLHFPTNSFYRNICTQPRPTFNVPSLCLDLNMRKSRVMSAFPYDSARAIPSPDKTSDGVTTPTPTPSKLYVSGLSFRTTEEGLRNAFEKFGRLVEVKLVMDRIARRSRGFGFIRYASEEEAKMAIEGMHGKFLDGRVIFVEVAKPPRPRTD